MEVALFWSYTADLESITNSLCQMVAKSRSSKAPKST